MKKKKINFKLTTTINNTNPVNAKLPDEDEKTPKFDLGLYKDLSFLAPNNDKKKFLNNGFIHGMVTNLDVSLTVIKLSGFYHIEDFKKVSILKQNIQSLLNHLQVCQFHDDDGKPYLIRLKLLTIVDVDYVEEQLLKRKDAQFMFPEFEE